MLKSAALQASRSKWKWAGHVARLHHTRWAQATTTWDPIEAREAEAGQAPDGLTISTNYWDHIDPKWRETEMSGKCWETS